ncbi:HelD family protein [Hathewaya limosa]|uniref:DNA helicase-2/ATP-dependent DNA helicase PcrA n=1 Tax=Hathewaya limosa TaxID=1536 RepID=A0ABU0JS92_HATLI|nr:UvrD-helicase domain-containing protein [Hathewaya limosa]MDQ0479973.1 DNA helicase-2/ATP-dependent DNA helicase PcrA [Hathewaya limosa]
MADELKKHLEKELQLEIEKEKLKEVIQIINEETQKVVKSRKSFLDELLEYRKKFIEEYRDDEDKVIEYFDHERFMTEEAFNLMDKKLKQLNILKISPYFGRVDFREEDYGVENLYIGRFGLIREEDYEPIVVDWRSPVASLFYQGKLGAASYEAPDGTVPVEILGRSQYIIKNSILKGMFNSEIDVKDEILQMVLSSNSEDKLKDIVMTIQKEQDEIIRTSPYTTVVVDGVAGSGKTTVALHRIAYLLYNYRKNLENKVLILGPNEIFMEYISEVLPTLGETAVKQSTFKDFALKLLGMEEEKIMTYTEYMEKILSKDQKFIEEILYKTSKEYIEKLNIFIKEFEENHFKNEDIYLMGYKVVTREEINELFNQYYKDMPLFRRSRKIKRIIISKLKDKRDELVREIQKEFKEKKETLTPEELLLQENDLDFRRKIAIREVIKDLKNVRNSLEYLNGEDIIDLYNNRINNNRILTMDDLAPILYLKCKLEGYKVSEEIKHVVIDEGQDFSELQFTVIKDITGASSMTILGDSNQRLIPIKEEVPLKNIGNIYDYKDIKEFALKTSYRSTKEIMEYANQFLNNNNIIPLVRNGEEVEEKNLSELNNIIQLILDRIYRAREKEYNTTGIICKNLEQCKEIYESIKDKINVKLIDKEDCFYKGGIVILPTYFAKGLEFDDVIAVFDGDKVEQEAFLKYVTATRALHKLTIINKLV